MSRIFNKVQNDLKKNLKIIYIYTNDVYKIIYTNSKEISVLYYKNIKKNIYINYSIKQINDIFNNFKKMNENLSNYTKNIKKSPVYKLDNKKYSIYKGSPESFDCREINIYGPFICISLLFIYIFAMFYLPYKNAKVYQNLSHQQLKKLHEHDRKYKKKNIQTISDN
eukprot:GHVL01027483.1.p1 GENE.GHVL01027483.1~~GHVL01027483.1.p1  ORF type:complete len:167 (+),score=61.48 GHVL01027483.1:25-525(+)